MESGQAPVSGLLSRKESKSELSERKLQRLTREGSDVQGHSEAQAQEPQVKTAQRITERPNPTPGSGILAPICGRLGQRPNRRRTVFEVKKEISVDSCFPLTTQGSILQAFRGSNGSPIGRNSWRMKRNSPNITTHERRTIWRALCFIMPRKTFLSRRGQTGAVEEPRPTT